MAPLLSGLPDRVADEEDLTRFLTFRGQFNSALVKATAFLPSAKHRNTSVFRIGSDPERIRACWAAVETAGRTLKAAATLKAVSVRSASLDVLAEEPPLAHANIEGWPVIAGDPQLEEAAHLKIANLLAKSSELVRL
jgi:hypothetical protein